MSDQDSKSSVTQTESEVNKTTMMKPKSTKIFRQLILPFITGVVGIVLGLALAVLILPQTSLFQSSPLGQYIEERSSQAAFEHHS